MYIDFPLEGEYPKPNGRSPQTTHPDFRPPPRGPPGPQLLEENFGGLWRGLQAPWRLLEPEVPARTWRLLEAPGGP